MKVSQSNRHVMDVFEYMCLVTNAVGSSCKRMDEFRKKQHENLVQKLVNYEIKTGRGLNQESSLTRPRATRWGSHYNTISRLLFMWLSTTQVLENIYDDGTDEKFCASVGNLGGKCSGTDLFL